MARSKKGALVAAVLSLAPLGCSHVSQRDVPVGHACQRGFAMELHPRIYHCVFELQGSIGTSPVFNKPDNRAQSKIIRALMTKDGGTCQVVATREMSDPQALLEHDLLFRAVTIRCE